MTRLHRIAGGGPRFSAFDVVNIIIMLAVCVACLYPFWNIYIYAFNEGNDSLKGALHSLPRKPTLANFALAFRQEDIAQAARISVLRTAVGIVVTISCVSLAAFATTKRHLPG